MDSSSFELLYKDTENALLNRHLKEALHSIQGILFETDNMAMSAELDSIRQDYSMMLHFMLEGASDPDREKIYLSLIRRTFALLDGSAKIFRVKKAGSLYADCFQKTHGNSSDSLDTLTKKIELLQDKLDDDQTQTIQTNNNTNEDCYDSLTELYNTLFDFIWTERLMNSQDADELKNFIMRQTAERQALLISAIYLNLTVCFDPQLFKTVLFFCSSDETQTRARALTTVVLSYFKYEKRLSCYNDLQQGISLLGQDPRIMAELDILQRQLFLSLETSKAEKKLKDEIFPDLLKNKFYQRHKMGLDELEDELNKTLRGEPNSEWEKNSGFISDKMNEIIEMGKEGIDINLGTFSATKGYSFFHQTANWFAPFDFKRKEVKTLFEHNNSSPLLFVINAGNFCESDKYSLCLLLNQFGSSERDFMISQFNNQIEGQAEESMKEAAAANLSAPHIYRNYLQNLYRFFKLHPQRAQFDDPFKMDLLFTNYPILDKQLNQPAYLADMASFLIKREYYQDAIDYLDKAIKSTTATAEMLQKIAFCYQHTDKPNQAIYFYQQADLLNPDNSWILQQMHLCYASLGKHEQELKCLENLETMNPEDARLISETGLCLMQLKRYEEAANKFYQLEYKGKKILQSWRAIAWCNFMMKKYEQAEKYYLKIISQDKVKWDDYLNAGHTALCMGKLKQAVEYYRTYINKYQPKNNNENKLKAFDDDCFELVNHGINQLDIALVRDMLTYDNNE